LSWHSEIKAAVRGFASVLLYLSLTAIYEVFVRKPVEPTLSFNNLPILVWIGVVQALVMAVVEGFLKQHNYSMDDPKTSIGLIIFLSIFLAVFSPMLG